VGGEGGGRERENKVSADRGERGASPSRRPAVLKGGRARPSSRLPVLRGGARVGWSGQAGPQSRGAASPGAREIKPPPPPLPPPLPPPPSRGSPVSPSAPPETHRLLVLGPQVRLLVVLVRPQLGAAVGAQLAAGAQAPGFTAGREGGREGGRERGIGRERRERRGGGGVRGQGLDGGQRSRVCARSPLCTPPRCAARRGRSTAWGRAGQSLKARRRPSLAISRHGARGGEGRRPLWGERARARPHPGRQASKFPALEVGRGGGRPLMGLGGGTPGGRRSRRRGGGAD
jgi:hypothetical protein